MGLSNRMHYGVYGNGARLNSIISACNRQTIEQVLCVAKLRADLDAGSRSIEEGGAGIAEKWYGGVLSM